MKKEKNINPMVWMRKDETKWIEIDDANMKIYYQGLIILEMDNQYSTNVAHVSELILQNKLDYNKLHGFYKLAIYDKQRASWTFLGDNQGSQIFFIDYQEKTFSESLLKIKRMRGKNLNPCYSAISLLFSGYGVLTRETILEDVLITDSEKVYELKDNQIKEFDKKLMTLGKNPGKRLHEVMTMLLTGIETKEGMSAVCTGGTDSRTILAHLTSLNIKPELIITGHQDNPDIKIAKKIADELRANLTVQNSLDKSADWIEKGFIFSDGIYDPVLSYRHYKKAVWSKEKGFYWEFGGVGGEYYKNSFCHPFRDFLFLKKVDSELLWEKLLKSTQKCYPWYGIALQKVRNEIKDKVFLLAEQSLDNDKLTAFNNLGMKILQRKVCCITNNMTEGCIKIDPLTHRDVIASVCKKSPISLSMHMWQRNEIDKYCSALSEIPTDQGYSCTLRPIKLVGECANKLKFYVGRIVARVRKKLGLDYVSSELHYWDKDYEEAAQTDLFVKSLEVCKQMGIIQVNAKTEDIPANYFGIIILIGMFFDVEFNKKGKVENLCNLEI